MADKTAILSVGIDVGTSTTQVVFSKLQMDNAGGYFSVPRVAIVDKEVVYKSEIYMTPLKTDVLIDTDALRNIVAAEFRKAGGSLRPRREPRWWCRRRYPDWLPGNDGPYCTARLRCLFLQSGIPYPALLPKQQNLRQNPTDFSAPHRNSPSLQTRR